MDCCWAPRLIRRVQYCFNGWWHQVLMWNIFFIPINVCKWIILFHRIYYILKMITEIWRKKMNLFRIFKRLCTIDHNKCVNFPFKNFRLIKRLLSDIWGSYVSVSLLLDPTSLSVELCSHYSFQCVCIIMRFMKCLYILFAH